MGWKCGTGSGSKAIEVRREGTERVGHSWKIKERTSVKKSDSHSQNGG